MKQEFVSRKPMIYYQYNCIMEQLRFRPLQLKFEFLDYSFKSNIIFSIFVEIAPIMLKLLTLQKLPAFLFARSFEGKHLEIH